MMIMQMSISRYLVAINQKGNITILVVAAVHMGIRIVYEKPGPENLMTDQETARDANSGS